MRVRWSAGRSNQSVLKEISPEYSLEGLILNLKLQYFGHLMRRANSLEMTSMLEKIEKKGAAEDEMTGYITDSMYEFEQTPGDSGGQRELGCCNPWDHKESDTTWPLNNSNNFLHCF